MRRIMVRYTVKPERVEENEALVQAVYRELGESRPEGFRYATFKLADGVTFVHVASLDGSDNPLAKTAAFAAFQQGIRERCQDPPVSVDLEEVGSYRFWGD